MDASPRGGRQRLDVDGVDGDGCTEELPMMATQNCLLQGHYIGYLRVPVKLSDCGISVDRGGGCGVFGAMVVLYY